MRIVRDKKLINKRHIFYDVITWKGGNLLKFSFSFKFNPNTNQLLEQSNKYLLRYCYLEDLAHVNLIIFFDPTNFWSNSNLDMLNR
jgi:hypothetical protein